MRSLYSRFKCTLAILFSFLAEKNQLKTDAVSAPYVLSLTRMTLAGFTIALISRIYSVPNLGWPEATLAVAVIIALPILKALDSAASTDVLALAHTLLSRFGIGDVSASNIEPDMYTDDERGDYTKREEVENA